MAPSKRERDVGEEGRVLLFAGRTILYWETVSEWISAVQVEPPVRPKPSATLARHYSLLFIVAKTSLDHLHVLGSCLVV